MRNRAGFTFIELLIVVLIIGFLAFSGWAFLHFGWKAVLIGCWGLVFWQTFILVLLMTRLREEASIFPFFAALGAGIYLLFHYFPGLLS